MAVLDDLQIARERIATQLKDMTLSPKPTYSIDGQSVSWGEHFRNLAEQLKILNELVQVEGGPMWEVTQGVP